MCRPQQMDCEIDAWSLFGHIILQICIDLFVTEVDLDPETDEQHVNVKGVETECACQPGEPKIDPLLQGGHPSAGNLVFDLLLRNVEPAEMLVLGLNAPQMCNPRADHQVDALEFGQKMIRRLCVRLH